MKKKLFLILFMVPLLISLYFVFRKAKVSKDLIAPDLRESLNIVLFTIDTLRADHLECYGYDKVKTPHINRLAAEGSLFQNVISSTPLTLPAHSSIFTGTYPLLHGVRDNGGFYLDPKYVTLAEVLKDDGYQTGAFVGAFVLDSRWGVDQGFDYYFDNFDLTKYKIVSLDTVQRRGDEVLENAREWVGRNSREKFFAWIHLYDPHTPYDPPEPYKARYKGGPYSLYDGEIAYVDELIGGFLDFLEAQNLTGRTLIVLTADHGESLGEHKESAHGFFVYDAAVRVPLIFHFSGAAGARGREVVQQVKSIDIMPTVLGLIGADVPPAVQGQSLVPLLQGREGEAEPAAYSETFFPRYHYGWSELRSLRQGRFKFINAPRPELYDVSTDPREISNIIKEKASLGHQMKRDLDSLIAQYSAPEEELAGPQNIDHDSMVKLQALGYIGAFHGSSAQKPGQNLADPKDKIELYNEIKLTQFLVTEEKLDQAEAKIRTVLEKDPTILEARYLAGNIYSRQKRYDEAVQEFKSALEVNPDYYEAVFGLALVYKETGKHEQAILGFRRLIGLDPKDTKPYFHLTDVYQDKGDLQEALLAIRTAVEINPESRFLRNRLGAVLLELKRYDEAEKEIRAALAVEKSQPLLSAHFNLALIHEARGELDQAVTEYREEQGTAPYNYKPDFNLGLFFLNGKQPQAAEKEFRSCLTKNEDYAPAYVFLAKVLMDAGKDLNEAETLALKGLGLRPDRSTEILGHLVLADIYNRLGQTEKSGRHVEAARQLQQAKTGT
ncbi:MAG: sulfatase-like hydrolase/transferase [Candidatus Aminicenantales bacterium]